MVAKNERLAFLQLMGDQRRRWRQSRGACVLVRSGVERCAAV